MTAYDELFTHGVTACERFAAREGHLSVPVGHIENGVRLNSWIRSRRRDYRGGALRPDRIQQLEGIPTWSWDGTREPGSRLQPTRPFIHAADVVANWARLGNALTDIPAGLTVNGIRVGKWVSRYRRLQQDGALTDAQVSVLARIPGWGHGESGYDRRWTEGMAALQQYVHEHGHASVPNRYATGTGYLLGRFVAEARTAHRKQTLRQDRVLDLEALPGWQWEAKRGRPKASNR